MIPADLVPTIGLEVHMHLATRTKMFCGCKVEYDARPNSCVCPVCLGMPGVLPVMNKKAVELAVRMALALGSHIADFAKWDRKHYYYPDLPKNYQISQYDQPLGVGGKLDIETSQGTRTIRIIRVHLEEDAGKLMHAEGGHYSIVDLNRTGTPLLEVVSEPDVHTAEEARVYGEALRQLAVYLGVSGGNMQMGQMRFEPNISLCLGTSDDGKPRYTPIAEIKNLNSFRSVERAVAFEIGRHRQEYQADPRGYTLEKLGKETRGWNDDAGTTFLQRSKEEAHDYRYLPDPDLVPFVPDRAWVEEMRATVGEVPDVRRRRFVTKYGLPEYDAGVLTAEKDIADYFENVAAMVGDPKTASNWVMQDVLGVLKKTKRGFKNLLLFLGPADLAQLIGTVKSGGLSRAGAKEVIDRAVNWSLKFIVGEKVIDTERKTMQEFMRESGLAQVSDTGALEAIVDQVLAANAKIAADYRGGKKAAFGRLMGETMKASGGKANPQIVKDLLTKKLGG
jgi:aspartyl-tRNA(Asn)/glutamyl-tRNA(Gln) amidotransferase subunit B